MCYVTPWQKKSALWAALLADTASNQHCSNEIEPHRESDPAGKNMLSELKSHRSPSFRAEYVVVLDSSFSCKNKAVATDMMPFHTPKSNSIEMRCQLK